MAKSTVDEKQLTKGELRKLKALKKSIGDQLGEEAFSKWLSKKRSNGGDSVDPNIELIQKALVPLMERVHIPRGGAYAVRRGRGRFIVEPVNLRS